MSPEKFQVGLHLYDVLSGEFVPKRYPKAGVQTLGRICTRAVRYGKPSVREFEGNSFAVFSDRPTWAKSILCEVDGDFTDPDQNEANMYGVLLRNRRGNTLYVNSPEPGTLDIGCDEYDRTYTLRLGASLAITRAAVTQAADDFFAIGAKK